MNKYLSFVLSAVFTLTALYGCSSRPSDNGDAEEKIMEYSKYDIDTYLYPLWQGKAVYNETIMFVGHGTKAPLIYKAEEIISVRSYDLKTEYVSGKDYIFDKKTNSLRLTEDSAIPFISESDYYPETKTGGNAFDYNGTEHRYIRFSEGNFFSSLQVAVTYRHDGKDYISIPKGQKEAFSSVHKKIKAGENVKILFYGDSITVGANSSKFIGYPPYADSWTEMVFSSLTKGNENAECINTAVGGWNSQNGLDEVEERVLNYSPDAVFIAFGMNDTSISTDKHIERIEGIYAKIRERLPECAICLISTMLPNPEVKGFYGSQPYFSEKYYELIEKLKRQGDESVCFADVTKVHTEILGRKRYFDMTGNNVNHPNDFMSRVYAQTVLQTVCG